MVAPTVTSTLSHDILRLKRRREAESKKPSSRITTKSRSFHRHTFNVRFLLLATIICLFVVGCLGASDDNDEEEETTRRSSVMVRTTMVTSTRRQTAPTSVPDEEEAEIDEDDEDEPDEEGIPVQGNQGMPTPFDTNLGKDFSSTTCPAFFQLFLEDREFKECLPLSAMLQNSKSFFEITKKSGFATTRVLDYSCAANYASCAEKMAYYARELKTPERCGAEFSAKNQLVIQAYAAFLSYPALYKAGCLKSESGSYCYVDAVTNVSSPGDSHVYYLPLGVNLPGASRPTCSTCMQETMGIFQEYAGNASLPLSNTYLPAAQQMNIACGPDFVNTTIQIVSGDAPGGSGMQRIAAIGGAFLVGTVLSGLIL